MAKTKSPKTVDKLLPGNADHPVKPAKKKSTKDQIADKLADIVEPLTAFQNPALTGRNPGTGENKEEAAPAPAEPAEPKPAKEIKKIKIINEKFLYLEFIDNHDNDTIRNPGTMEYGWIIHDNLKAAMQAFAPHSALLLGYIDYKKVKGELSEFKSPVIDSITVLQAGLGGADEGISITIKKKVYKKTFPVNVPFTKFYEEGDNYPFATDLELAWSDLVACVMKYLDGTERGTPAQGEFDFDKDKQRVDNKVEQSDIVELAK